MTCLSLSALYGAYSAAVGFIADHVDALAAAVTLCVFVKAATGIFPSGLRKVFGPSGITGRAIFRALFLCWRSRSEQRVFFEFALIRSQGAKLDAQGWDEICGDFAVFSSMSRGQKARYIEIKNCTHLTSREFVTAVSRYFDFLATPRASRFYSIGRYDDYWHSVVQIAEAYITPSALLSGLMSRFDSNWSVFIDQYRASLPNAEAGTFQSTELYGLFSWLLWGPSREIKWRDGWDGLCQISYGDENNSLLAYADGGSGAMSMLRDGFVKASERGCFGTLCSAGVRLAPKKTFLGQFRFGMNVENAYYVDKMVHDEGLSFVPRVEYVKPIEVRVSNRWYSTAYLWLLFERECVDGEFHPDKSVAFFEHANIADANVCAFLCERLADKAVAHFREVYRHPEMRSNRYNFVCGLNSAIEKSCTERIMKLIGVDAEFAEWMKGHVCLVPRREPTTVFAALDEFFANSEHQLHFVDVDVSNSRECAELALFYSGIYSDSFPNEDERESLTNLLEYLKISRKSKVWDFHVILAMDEQGRMVGGSIFDYFADANSAVIEFICVDERLRSRHIGQQIWKKVLKTADADSLANGHPYAKHVFCEVESPDMRQDKCVAHLEFWKGNWFRRLDFNYIQPALGAGQSPVRGMWFLGLTRFSENSQIIDSTLLQKVLWNYAHYSMGIKNPENDPLFLAMQSEVMDKKAVEMIDF